MCNWSSLHIKHNIVNQLYSNKNLKIGKQQILLYITGNYIQYLIISYNRKEYEKLNQLVAHLTLTQHYKSSLL